MDKRYMELAELSEDEIMIRGLSEEFDILEIKHQFLPIDDYYYKDVPGNLPAWREDFLKLTGDRMDLIMENYTLIGRIDYLVSQIPLSLDVKAKELSLKPNKLRKDILSKVKTGASLTRVEQDYVDDLVECDKRDYYPPRMSRQQIYKAIREAYNDAKKLSVRQNPSLRELDDSGNQTSSGSVMYSGIGSDLTIHFWYNFTDAAIETAYPWYGYKERS